MSKMSFPSLIVLCAALAACTDTDRNRTVTAPGAGPVFSEASAELLGGTTVDDLFDLAFATEDASVQMAAAQQATTGSRASGHVAFTFNIGQFGSIATEQYSFVALSTDPSTPFAAKGEYELMLTTVTGRTNKVHGDVICMSTVGNTTRIAGQIRKVWVNNVQVPITAATHNIWTVQDNGEGQGTTDQASPMIFFRAAGAQFHCATGFTPPLFAPQEGNVQVQP